MTVSFEKELFVENLLGPVSKIADNLSLSFIEEGFAKTMVSSADNSVILLSKIPCKVSERSGQIIIPDCKTFLRLFSGVNASHATLIVDSNAISYKDKEISFKYHLLDESYITNKKSFSEEKLSKIVFDTTFECSRQKMSEIIKYNSIVPDAEKLYFFTDNGKVYAKLGDEQKANTNEIVTEVADVFTGNFLLESLPINIQSILLFSFGSNLKVEINSSLKLLKFSTSRLSYIVSGLVK